MFCFSDKRSDKTIESGGTSNPRTTLYDVYSSIRLVPTADDDDMKYTCEAHHSALHRDMPLKTTVLLSVLCKYENSARKTCSGGYANC